MDECVDIEKQSQLGSSGRQLSTVEWFWFISVTVVSPGVIFGCLLETNLIKKNHSFFLYMCVMGPLVILPFFTGHLVFSMRPVPYFSGLERKWYSYLLKSLAEICGFGIVWLVHYFNTLQDVWFLVISCVFMFYFLAIEQSNQLRTYPFFFNLFGYLTMGMTVQVLGTKYSSLGVVAYVCFLTLLRNWLNTFDHGGDNGGTSGNDNNDDDNDGDNNNASNSNSIK